MRFFLLHQKNYFFTFSAAVKSLRVNDCRNGEKQNVAMLQLIQKLKRKDEKDARKKKMKKNMRNKEEEEEQ